MTRCIDELRKYADRPVCWFPLNQRPDRMLNGQTAALMDGLIRVARLSASAELAARRPGDALADVSFSLRLADYARQQPQPTSIIYAQHHLAVVDALQPVWEGLTRHAWTATQVAELQRELAGLDLLRDYEYAVRADALTMATLAERLIPTANPRPPQEVYPDVEDQRMLAVVRLIYPTGWSFQDQAAIHRFHLETTSRYLDLNKRQIVGQRHGDPRGLFTSSDPFFPIFIVPKIKQMFDDALESFPFAQTVVDLATLACALERHRLAQGEFPATLEALVPQFVAKLPHDIITGEPLKYRRTAGAGFVLYSAGFNQVDDGGTPCVRHTNWQGQPEPRFDLDRNDWVWICPDAAVAK